MAPHVWTPNSRAIRFAADPATRRYACGPVIPAKVGIQMAMNTGCTWMASLRLLDSRLRGNDVRGGNDVWGGSGV